MGGEVKPAHWPIRGVRVDGETVVLSVKGGNDAARWLCGEILAQMEAGPVGNPIGYMSALQVAAIKDPDDASGTYIPIRKTPRGLFTLALYAAPVAAPVAVPQGWKLVPVEATVGMCIAGDGARHNVDDLTRTPAVYRAMLAAAPAAPAVQPATDSVPMPQSAEQARAMWLIGERWIRDKAPEMLRPAPQGASKAPAVPPLTDEQIEEGRRDWLHGPAGVHPSGFYAGVRFAEKQSGITGPLAPAALPEPEPEFYRAARAVVAYRHSMSYNDSYFGEPAGLFKTLVANLDRALPPQPVKAASTPVPLCMCKDRPASECPGEWEPGCDLGNNPKHARRHNALPFDGRTHFSGFVQVVGPVPDPMKLDFSELDDTAIPKQEES